MLRSAFWEDDEPRYIESTVAEALAEHLTELGVEQAFGVDGGGIATVYDAIVRSPIELSHCRHENGAAYAAMEASLVTGKPTAVFATTGPGLINVLSGMRAAKYDGAQVVLISGVTGAGQRGRWATQETSAYTLPSDSLYASGPLFDFAVRVEEATEMPEVLRRLSIGLAGVGGFIGHVALPIPLTNARVQLLRQTTPLRRSLPTVHADEAAQIAKLLQRDGFAIWVGSGAVGAADRIRALVERAGAYLYSSPRGKGILPEDHPRCVGVTGLGGHHDEVVGHVLMHRPERVLVLGTRLGEATSLWDEELVPAKGFIHVDLDPDVPGTAYPEVATVGVQSDVGAFLDALLPHFPEAKRSKVVPLRSRDLPPVPPPRIGGEGPVRPQVLMARIQQQVVRDSRAIVLAECGNAAAWCVHHLRFSDPGRLRTSPGYGSDGHAVAGVVGVSRALGEKAVAVVSDQAMLTSAEVSTAVQYQLPAVWIVLNDGGYGGRRASQQALGLAAEHFDLPAVDFVAMARSLGASGRRVLGESELEAAIEEAMASKVPFVLDVVVDPDEPSPLELAFERHFSDDD